ncbi:MAG: FmdB family zinc ribbon protein [Castellaniella sp.]
MPIYVYRCSQCGHQQDVLQKISDPRLSTCPACGQGTYEKQVTAAGFRLKGSGWYETDFRGKSGSHSEGVLGSSSHSDAASGGNSNAAPASGASTGATSTASSASTASSSASTASSGSPSASPA